jgi:hypothetical protein
VLGRSQGLTFSSIIWHPIDRSILIIASQIAAARHKGRQEEQRRWCEWYDGLLKAYGQADRRHDWDWDRHASLATKPVLSREDLISTALSAGTVRGESEVGIGLRNCHAFVSSRRGRWIQRRRGSLLSHWMIGAAANAV